MISISIELAKSDDEAELRRLTAEMPMPGFIQVAYTREPDFFKAQMVEGRKSQTIIGRDTRNGKIAGMGSRSIKQVYVNGEKQGVGYLSSLRVLSSYRGSIHLARGYELLRELHEDKEAVLYLSTMVNANKTAEKLTRNRARLPSYNDIGQFRTMAISLAQKPGQTKANGLMIRAAATGDVNILVDFLNSQGKRRQFFPVYTESDFFAESGLLYGLRPEDILLAFHGEQLKGVMAAWDQKLFRQSVVKGYSKWVAAFRPLYNLWARIAKLPTLPAAGSILNYCYLALLCIQDDNPEVCSALLNELIMRNRKRYSFIMAGLHEKDPLLPVISRLRHLNYLSRLYAVCWQDGEAGLKTLNHRTPYLELGSL